MKAVHFGAGNIGRGFIGLLLDQSGYEVTFVDVNDEVITAINQDKSYQVHFADDTSESSTVRHISGINSMKDPKAVTNAIIEADIVTTAVGPNILPIIAKAVAKGLGERIDIHRKPLAVIACENMIGGSTLLKKYVYQEIEEMDREGFDDLFSFPDAAVDRIVPNQTNENLLDVTVEPYYEWVVEKAFIQGELPEIKGITYVDELGPYIERKLFTVNTGHAATAYLGSYLGHTTIFEALQDKTILDMLNGALQESGQALIEAYGFDVKTHEAYIQKIISRFQNPHISDEVNRVARGPLRKLGPKDRFVRPASMYLEFTSDAPKYLSKAMAAALLFHNQADEEAVQLQKMIEEKGVKTAFTEVSGLEQDHPITQAVISEYEKMN
ncbi:mannitol-1-phosphate 5-dehydrogenase [Oceanobacillus neutriphilus]|uniref:Mannitol-1-phosphate 5-dehydrogenase n=1 Tax=Oceanobacillus neutriphilus TaxID=531815 RepID=A0ABQ2NNZ4_9BACI|nr:mannitol-1-phosphate 5-dehydrogenase [Oceanobacillus neutriphilus]GGP07067.1 mannitol-1-phosphate 5-dehydrogenase [Oceanobacillus neutriphilus]